MIKEIVKYPTTPSKEFGAIVRFFDAGLFELIQDLKDTIEANNLTALAAFQINSPLAVIILKQENGEFLEIINPVIIKREGTIYPVETTAYFPGLSATTTRYEKIKVMYSDRADTQQFLEADGELSITFQRKIDYLFGANFRLRLSKEEQAVFDSKLEFGTDAITQNGCPTVFKRDRILLAMKALFAIGILALFAKLFISAQANALLKMGENYLMLSMLLLTIIYFFYAQIEAKQYKQCSSCQIGNIIGTSALSLLRVGFLFVLNYFVF
jgi:peptide deformylase